MSLARKLEHKTLHFPQTNRRNPSSTPEVCLWGISFSPGGESSSRRKGGMKGGRKNPFGKGGRCIGGTLPSFSSFAHLGERGDGKKEHKTNPICLSTPGRERGEEGEGEGGEKARTRVWDSSTFRLERWIKSCSALQERHARQNSALAKSTSNFVQFSREETEGKERGRGGERGDEKRWLSSSPFLFPLPRAFLQSSPASTNRNGRKGKRNAALLSRYLSKGWKENWWDNNIVELGGTGHCHLVHH